jgi:hypothetical protein
MIPAEPPPAEEGTAAASISRCGAARCIACFSNINHQGTMPVHSDDLSSSEQTTGVQESSPVIDLATATLLSCGML